MIDQNISDNEQTLNSFEDVQNEKIDTSDKEENDIEIQKNSEFHSPNTFEQQQNQDTNIQGSLNKEINSQEDIDLKESLDESIENKEDTLEKNPTQSFDEDKVDEYVDNANQEINENENIFSLKPFIYSADKTFEIEKKDYDRCVDNLKENAFVVLTNPFDLLSKYYTKHLLQFLDRFGKVEKSEVIISQEYKNENKLSFLDLESFLLELEDNQLLVLDLYLFSHVEKEYFLNTFYTYLKSNENYIRFRELLFRKKIKLIILSNSEEKFFGENTLNTYQVMEKDNSIIEKPPETSIEEIISVCFEEVIEVNLLFLVSLFKGLTPTELQEILLLSLNEEDTIRWKKERKKFLENTYLTSSVSEGTSTIIEFDTTLKNKEEKVLSLLEQSDPFFIIELFDNIEKNEKLLSSLLFDKKSKLFTDGFFQLIKRVSENDPNRLSLEWFIDRFENGLEYPIIYFFSLSSCALEVSHVLNDYEFLDKLVNYFYKQNAVWPLYYLTEYFSHIDTFDKFKWYKNILSILIGAEHEGKLFSFLYKSITKEIYIDFETINVLLLWTKENNNILNGHILRILMRLASDSVKDNKNWDFDNVMPVPFILEPNDKGIMNESRMSYLQYLFDYQTLNVNSDKNIFFNSIAENLNKLFFMKILGLTKHFEISRSEQKRIIRGVSIDLNKLLTGTQKDYFVFLVLLLFEWHFIYRNNIKDSYTSIFVSCLTEINSEERKIMINNLNTLSSILLKLSSKTRRYKKLSATYTKMRKLIRDTSRDINKHTRRRNR